MRKSQNQDQPLFVIAVCTRNRTMFDANCALGLGQLTLPPNFQYAIILVENNSNATPCDADEHIAGLRLHHFVEPRHGLAFARNRALIEADRLEAMWLAFVDDDAKPLPDWIEEYVSAISASPSHKFFYGQYWYQYPEGYSAAFPQDPTDLNLVKSRKTKFGGGNLLIHRDIFNANRENLRFDPRFNGCGGEDIDFRRQATTARINAIPVPSAVIVERIEGERTLLSRGLSRHLNHGVSSIVMAKKHGSTGRVAIGLSVHVPKLLIELLSKTLLAFVAHLSLSPVRRQLLNETLMAGARFIGMITALFGYRGCYYLSRSRRIT